MIKNGRAAHHINREQEGTGFFLRFVEDIFSIHQAGAQTLDRKSTRLNSSHRT